MDALQAFGLGFLCPGYAAEGDYPLMGKILGPRVRAEVVHTTVGEAAYEEGTPKDLGDSSLLLDGAVRTGVFLTDKKGLTAMDELYETFVSEPYPARKTVYVRLPEGLKVEIGAIALVDKNPG